MLGQPERALSAIDVFVFKCLKSFATVYWFILTPSTSLSSLTVPAIVFPLFSKDKALTFTKSEVLTILNTVEKRTVTLAGMQKLSTG